MATIDREKLGEYLSAYLDGELDDADRQAIERLVARDARARNQLDELRKTVDLVRALPRRAAPPSMLEDLTAVAEREELLGDPADAVPLRRPWWHSARPVMSMAAVIAITMGGGLIVYRGMYEPEAPRMLADAGAKEEPTDAALTDDDRSAVEATSMLRRRTAAEMSEPRPAVGERLRALGYIGPTESEEAEKAPSTEETRLAFAPAPPESMVAKVGPAARDPMFRRLVAGLNLKQKNEAKLGGEALVSHWFANESNQIVLGVSDGDDESLARAQLAGFVKDKGMRLVFPEPNTPSLSNAEPLCMEGRAGRNYARTDASQVLVRLPVSAAEELLTAVGYSVTGRRPIQMTVGPLVAKGLEKSRSLARQMRRPATSGPKMLIDELASSRGAGEERAKAGPRYFYGANGNAVVVEELGRSTSGTTGAATALAKKVDGSDVGKAYRSMRPRDREVADAARESRAGVSGVIYRLLGAGEGPDREKTARLGLETDDRKDAEEKSEVAPGRLVVRNLGELRRRGNLADETTVFLDVTESRDEYAPADRLVTLIVQFQRLPTVETAATQPATPTGMK